MKWGRFLKKLLLLLLLTIYCVGCNSWSVLQQKTQESNTSPTISSIAYTKQPFETTSPSITSQPTLTPTSTKLPHTFTPTSIPTLNNTERGVVIEELIRTTNADCKLPCVWGFTPGESIWTDATRFFIRMGAIFDNKSKAVINYTLSFDASARGASVEHIYNFFTFSTQDQDVIDLIDVEGMGGEIPVEFPRLWEGYSPERIISDYEKPSRIFLSSTPYDVRNTGYVGYFLWLFYDNQGFMIRYDGVIKFTPTYHICPRIQHEGEITNIHLVSVGPGSTLALETQDEIFGSDYHKVIALEEATGITIDMFTQLFKHNQISSCFESPLDVWK